MALTTPSRTRGTSALLSISLAVLLFGAVVLAHSLYVSLFASNYPFWDQWDQLHHELVPLWHGRGSLSLLFAPHNEHRIFFTRILSMLLLWMNHGHWSNLVEAYANTLIWGGVLTLFFLLVARDIKPWPTRIVLLLSFIGMGCLPFDWENTLVGFQSQFYLMVGAALLLAACAAYAADTLHRSVFMLFLGVASLFTMASGLFAPLVGLAVLVMRGLPTRTWSTRTLLTAAGLFVTTLVGLIILPHVPGDIPMQAKGIVEHALGMLRVLMWPLEGIKGANPGFMLLLWLPACIGLGRLLLRTKVTGSELLLLGMAGWVVLQAFAIVHARGHDLTVVPSRYTDILAVGVLANTTMTILWASSRDESRALRGMSASWLLLMLPLLGWIMIQRTPGDFSGMAVRGMYSQIQTTNVSRFLVSGDDQTLEHPGLEIPYPSASTLERYLLEPEIRSMVASTSGTYSTATPDARLTRLAEALRDRERTFATRLGITFLPAQFQPLSGSLLTQGESKSQAVCTVDAVNGSKPAANVTMQSGELFGIQGWIIWPNDIASSNDAVMTLSDHTRYQIDLDMAANRPDVVKALQSAPALTRGFSVAAPLGLVVPGTYTATIAKAISPNATIYCKLPFTLTVTP